MIQKPLGRYQKYCINQAAAGPILVLDLVSELDQTFSFGFSHIDDAASHSESIVFTCLQAGPQIEACLDYRSGQKGVLR